MYGLQQKIYITNEKTKKTFIQYVHLMSWDSKQGCCKAAKYITKYKGSHVDVVEWWLSKSSEKNKIIF